MNGETDGPPATSYERGAVPGAAPRRHAPRPPRHPGRPRRPAARAAGQVRWLEVGCGDGGNLLPMAEALPDSTIRRPGPFRRPRRRGPRRRGRDRAAQRRAAAARPAGGAADLGPFDYVLAHGVFSGRRSRRARVCWPVRPHLTAHGVAYISYNVYPGWHARAALRGMMAYHTRRWPRPAGAGQAGAGARRLPRRQRAGRGRPTAGCCAANARRSRTNRTLIAHDELEAENRPFLLPRIRRPGGGPRPAVPHRGGPGRPPPPPAAEEALARLGADVVSREQYRDFLTNRMFRQTLLCRADAPLRATPPGAGRCVPRRRAGECLSAKPDLRPGKAEEFRARRA